MILPSKDWTFRNYSKNGVTFAYRYRVVCDEDYHGKYCNVYCKAKDDVFGHYLCHSNGTKFCLSGYTGSVCDKRKYFTKTGLKN